MEKAENHVKHTDCFLSRAAGLSILLLLCLQKLFVCSRLGEGRVLKLWGTALLCHLCAELQVAAVSPVDLATRSVYVCACGSLRTRSRWFLTNGPLR